jgi:hypothetical protein
VRQKWNETKSLRLSLGVAEVVRLQNNLNSCEFSYPKNKPEDALAFESNHFRSIVTTAWRPSSKKVSVAVRPVKFFRSFPVVPFSAGATAWRGDSIEP